jgi:cytochrome c oxidase assembly factor 6
MGWFSTSSPTTTNPPEPSKDGGYIAPDRSAREVCYEGRDAFFRCLDRNNIIDSVKEDELAKKLCVPELRAFEKACAESWVRV